MRQYAELSTWIHQIRVPQYPIGAKVPYIFIILHIIYKHPFCRLNIRLIDTQICRPSPCLSILNDRSQLLSSIRKVDSRRPARDEEL